MIPRWDIAWVGDSIQLDRIVDGPVLMTITASDRGLVFTASRAPGEPRPAVGVGAIFRLRSWLDTWLDFRDELGLTNLRPVAEAAWKAVELIRSGDANKALASVAELL